MLYTAQYRYSGEDRFDITVRGNTQTGKLYAPTWSMVNGIKNKTLSYEDYTAQYYDLLLKRWITHSTVISNLVDKIQTEDVTFVCFCPAGSFCHRYLLVNFLQYNWHVEYGGERK